MMLQIWWRELGTWWSTVTPEFAFLLGLPFMVALVGLVAHAWRRRRSK
jgi:biotin transporter BioY